MNRLFSDTRTPRLIVAAITASLVFGGCQSDEVTSSFIECTGQPGCQAAPTAVAPEVIQALNDVSSRVVDALKPAVRVALRGALARLETTLMQRDIDAGRAALSAALAAITQAERTDTESRPDLGALRLGLAPAARSLGLPVSVIEAPTP